MAWRSFTSATLLLKLFMAYTYVRDTVTAAAAAAMASPAPSDIFLLKPSSSPWTAPRGHGYEK